MKQISRVLDKYFEHLSTTKGNTYIKELIPDVMLDKSKISSQKGIGFWKAIPGTITDLELETIEKRIKCHLPSSYKFFLRERHFIELELGKESIRFFKSLTGHFVTDFISKMNHQYEELISKKYIPIAEVGDYGILCFHANKEYYENEFPLIIIDYETGFYPPEHYATNLEELFKDFEIHLDDWIQAKNS